MTRAKPDLRPLVAEAVAPHETVLAEGACFVLSRVTALDLSRMTALDFVRNPVYIILTNSRVLWRHYAASWDPAAFPPEELVLADIDTAQEFGRKGRAHFEVRTRAGRELVFDFSRPETKAATALRELLPKS